MSCHRALIGGTTALVMSASLLMATASVSTSDDSVSRTMSREDTNTPPRRQRARLEAAPHVRPGTTAPDKGLAALTGTVKPVRVGRTVKLQVKWKTWKTVAMRKQKRNGQVSYVAPIKNGRGRAVKYRLVARPYQDLRRVTSEVTKATLPTTTTTTTTLTPSTALTNTPAQAAGLIYSSSAGASAYAHPGGLVVAGRDNYADQPFKDVSAAGGTVLMYIDPMIDNAYGRYHQLLLEASVCGPATSLWPGSPQANEWGRLTDFRVGSVLQQKFECVLETMVRENPHMAGWFADDLGSRSWFPNINWAAFPDKQAYREGAIALTQTLRKVADKYRLMFMVNGTWSANDGGGYPDAGQHGNALADGGFVEHHDGQIGYFGPYGCSSQWAAQSPVTNGKAFNYAVTSSPSGTAEYVESGCYAFVNEQSDYSTVAPWGSFHPTGLPTRVTR